MDITARYSVCIPNGDLWEELSAHHGREVAFSELDAQLITEPTAVLWDWATNTIIQKELS